MIAKEVLTIVSIILLSTCALLFISSLFSRRVKEHRFLNKSYGYLIMLSVLLLSIREYVQVSE